MADGLLDRIGRTLRTAGSGIGDILAAGGQAYAPPDMNLTRNQQMGLLGARLGDMMVGPRGEMTNNTPTYLQDIRNNQTRLDVTAAIQADPDLTPAEKQSLLSLPTSNQIEFMQNKMETKYAPSGLLQAPSSVREFNFYQTLTEDEKAIFERLKRQNPYLNTGGSLLQPNPLDPTGTPLDEIPITFGPGESPEDQAARARAVGDEEVSTAQQIALDAAEIDRETASEERDIERLDDFNLDKNTFNQNLVDIDYLIQKGEEILAHPGFDMAFGFTSNLTGGGLNVFGGTDAQNLVQTFKDNEFAEMIGRMREQSATGGAVGQVSEKEGERFENMLGDLRFSSSEDQARANLERIIRELKNSKKLYRLSMQNRYKDLSESEGLFISGYEASIGRTNAFNDVPGLTQQQRLTLERGGELSEGEYDLLSNEDLQMIVQIQEELGIGE